MAAETSVSAVSRAAGEKIIVALDVPTADAARGVVCELEDVVGAFKIGLQLFTVGGPELVREFVERGVRIFLDLKFHDIPNTVSMAGVESARLGVWMFNLHTAGGSEMMRRTFETVASVCDSEGLVRPLITGVTVLTSSDAKDLGETGVAGPVEKVVVSRARLAADSGLDGIVASPHEVAAIKQAVGRPDFIAVTPGIRAGAATMDDQKRVMTFRQALDGGSDHVVIGRPILEAADRRRAVTELIENV